MDTIRAIYEHGIIRPVSPISLPEACEIEFEPRIVQNLKESSPDPVLGCNSPELYAILRRSYDTGERDLAARIDEIDP